MNTLPFSSAAGNNTNKNVMLKNWAQFTDCIIKINNTQVDNAKENDMVIPIYNLIEFTDNYSNISGSLWRYYRHEPSLNSGENNIVDFTTVNPGSKSFRFKQKITNETDNTRLTKQVKIMLSSRDLGNVWRTREMHLINYEVKLAIMWSKNCLRASNTAIEHLQ